MVVTCVFLTSAVPSPSVWLEAVPTAGDLPASPVTFVADPSKSEVRPFLAVFGSASARAARFEPLGPVSGGILTDV